MIAAKNGGLVALAVVLAVGCGGGSGAATEAPAPARPTAAPASSAPPVVLFLGTSLTAGLGLDPSEGYPALIQKKIDAAGLAYRVVNAGVSGETSAGAASRIDWLLRQRVAVLVVETGANDGLRGHEPEALRRNIQTILERARRQQPSPRIVLAGMQAPVNLGAEYGRQFRSVYPELARENGAVLIPFLLEGVAAVPALNQDDGIHPNARGQQVIAETVWRYLEPLLRP